MARSPLPWTTVPDALANVQALLAVSEEDSSEQLSALLAPLVSHDALAVLAGSCARSPLKASGRPEVAGRITSSDVASVARTVGVGKVWQGRATIAGEERLVLACASSSEAASALIVFVRDGDEPVDDATADVVQRVWNIFSAQLERHLAEASPADLTVSRAAASERSRVTAELTDAHAAALSALLGTLRAHDLDDGAARRAATDLAASALVELRSTAEHDRDLTDETAAHAFAMLRDELRPLVRYSETELELSGAEDDDRSLPAPVAQAARAIVRGAVLAMLEQRDVGRIRVGWEIGDDLVVTVRDDGPGTVSEQALALHQIVDRAQAIDGSVDVESVPGWGTRLLGRLPLRPAGEPAHADPLATLGAREMDVLAQLARGRRNRQIAEELGISENTVKFHVANVLSKLGVSSRGEAAIVARDAGLTPAPLHAVS